MNEADGNAGGSGPGGEQAAALQARMERLESAVAALSGELGSVREQLMAMGWRRAPVPPFASPAAAPPVPTAHPVAPMQSVPVPMSAVQNPMYPIAGAPASPQRVMFGFPANSVRGAAERGDGERTQSLESKLGSRVLSKLAVVLLLVGAAWFFKWAFDNRWVGQRGRVLIGLLAGAAVVVWSERFRRQSLAAFSYALKAVGTGVLYLSLWAGFQLYHLMPATVALLAMIAVTAANAAMALTQESPLLMGYALLGAYLTPALLSTGGNHEVFLFTYLLAVAVSVVGLLRFRPWHLLLCGALPITVVYYIAWYVAHYRADEFGVTLLFSMLLWAAFAAVPLTVKESEQDAIVDVLVPLGAAAFGALAVYSVLVDSARRPWEPWWALLFAAAYLLLMRVRRGSLASAIHLSLAIVFLTITIPLKATGRGITAGWLAEAVVLLWVATLPQADRRARTVLRLLGCGSLALGVAGALIGPVLPFTHGGPAFLNRDFAVSLGALVALALAARVSLRKREGEAASRSGKAIATAAFLAGNVVLLAAMGREIGRVYVQHAAAQWELEHELSDFTFSAWLMVQGVANLVAGFMRRVALARWVGLLLLGVTLLKVFAYDMRSLGTGYHVLSYLGLGVVMMAVSFAYQKDWLHLREVVASDSVDTAPGAER